MSSRRNRFLVKRRARLAARPSRAARRSLRASLRAGVLEHELLGLDTAGGMCRMLLSPTQRLDRPARDSAECDSLAAKAGAIQHLFVPK
jgi:hypothetical protein